VRDQGRLTLFARGVRGPKPRFAGVLQPFELLLLSFQVGREAGQLTGAESAQTTQPLPAASLMAGFYLNELLLKLTVRHDPMAEVFDDYRRALDGLRSGEKVEVALRLFEKRLLEAMGYGVDLTSEARTGKAVQAGCHYRFRAAEGVVAAAQGDADAVAGSSLLALAAERLEDGRSLEDARRVLKAALAERLEGQALATSRVARALAGARPR
jgi:DNA repair protein RecO (recombination protein O)